LVVTIEQAQRKLQLAADRELERVRRGEDMTTRARRNLERGQRNTEHGRSRVRYFQERLRDLNAASSAAESCS
jgi:hypothetical protein